LSTVSHRSPYMCVPISAERATNGRSTASVSGQPRAIARPSHDQQRTVTAAPIRSAAKDLASVSGFVRHRSAGQGSPCSAGVAR
jgi:hypothetical protein